MLKIFQLKPSIGVRNTIALSVNAIPQFTQILNKLYEDFHAIRIAEENAPTANSENASAKKSPQQPIVGKQDDGGNATSNSSNPNNNATAVNANAEKTEAVEGEKPKGTANA